MASRSCPKWNWILKSGQKIAAKLSMVSCAFVLLPSKLLIKTPRWRIKHSTVTICLSKIIGGGGRNNKADFFSSYNNPKILCGNPITSAYILYFVNKILIRLSSDKCCEIMLSPYIFNPLPHYFIIRPSLSLDLSFKTDLLLPQLQFTMWDKCQNVG